MHVNQGQSASVDASVAVQEATSGFPRDRRPPDLVLVFASTKQDPDALARALAARFPGSPVVGCTTAGELLDDGYATGSVAISAIWSPEVKWAVRSIRGLGALDAAGASRVADDLFGAMSLDRSSVDPARQFSFMLIDGLSMREEHVASLMADALEGLPVFGGSAGDDLGFRATRVFVDGEARSDAAVVVLASSRHPFTVIKHQHYTTTPRSLVITRADVAARRVYEMDGYPALEAYAAALDLRPEDVTGEVTFTHPLTFLYNGEIYVRSVQRVEPDGSMIFYCGIEEGMVLSLGAHEPMVAAMERDLAPLFRGGQADLFIACNCILRGLEADKAGLYGQLGAVMRRCARNVIGFNTYGEQLNGLHINQTLVGVCIRGDEALP